jgi:ribosomal protein S18 acetylase RimI-like enzyme
MAFADKGPSCSVVERLSRSSMHPRIYRNPFHSDAGESVIAFALANPLMPFHPPRQLRRFIGHLISDRRLVIDVHDEQGRVACAVLLDNLRNRNNSAGLVIMGFDRRAPAAAAYDLLLREAKAELPTDKAGIEIDFCDDSPVDLDFLQDRGFRPLYATFEMLKQNGGHLPAALPEGYGWRDLTLAELPEYYRVLTTAFADNLEMNFTSLDEMGANLPTRRIPGTLLLHRDQIIGFHNVFVDAEDGAFGEISSIGLLPAYRGRGLGRLLLGKAVEELSNRNVRDFKLMVAATNETALGLYTRSGFKVCRRDWCLRYPSSDG